jgi:hypothetical protein
MPNDCRLCQSYGRCAYVTALEPPPKAVPGLKRGTVKTPPRPYVVKVELTEYPLLLDEEPLHFELVLVGPAAENLPYIFTILENVAIGPERSRNPFTLESIVCASSGKTVYDAGVFVAEPEAAVVPYPEKPGESLKLVFRSPYIIKRPGDRRAGALTDFRTFLIRLHERTAELTRLYGKPGAGIEDRINKTGAEDVRCRRARNEVVYVRIPSKRRGSSTVRAYAGEVEFEGDWSKWARLVAAGEVFHIGEDTVKGFGWYEYGG